MRDNAVLSVTQLNEYIKLLIEGQPVLRNVFVRGEISNFVNHRTGHWYFSLKDDGGLVRCVMFRGSNMKVAFLPENGMRVILQGRVGAYVKDGQYQIYAEDMQPDGVGALYLAFEQLKARLEAEGLFAEERKRKIPRIPESIGIITSPTGAAVRDMLNITRRRFPLTEIIIYPSLVQGAGAPSQLVGGIEYFNTKRPVSLIIIGRGGGSLEDLWAFNDERLARAVADSEIPVISAVGHETDFTICDFAADLRAPTPSAAAELAVPDGTEMRYAFGETERRMAGFLMRNLSQKKDIIKALAERRPLAAPISILNEKRMTADYLSERLDRAVGKATEKSRASLMSVAAKLTALNPMAVLSRGYGAVGASDGTIICKAGDLVRGQSVKIKFADGTANAEITDIKLDKDTKGITK